MNNPYDFLLEIGLNKSQARLYLAGLKLGSSKVSQLMTETGVKKPNIYVALDGLVENNLALESKVGKELIFTMEQPSALSDYVAVQAQQVAQKGSRLGEVIESFPKTKTNPKPSSPAKHFLGEEKIKKAIDIALSCQSRHWDIVAPVDNFIARCDKSYIGYFKKARRGQRITSRSLWESKFADKDLTLSDLISRKPRYLPEKYKGNFSGMMILFDKKVLFVGLSQAELIIDPDTYSVCNLLFDSLWSVSQKP